MDITHIYEYVGKFSITYKLLPANLYSKVNSIRIYGLKREGGELLKGVFENFFRFNKILCVNPIQESS